MAKRRRPQPSPDSSLVLLSRDEAIRRIEEDPESLCFPIGNFMEVFGLSREQCRREAAAGRLKINGKPHPGGGYTDLAVTGKDAIEWLAKYRMSN